MLHIGIEMLVNGALLEENNATFLRISVSLLTTFQNSKLSWMFPTDEDQALSKDCYSSISNIVAGTLMVALQSFIT